MLNDCQLLTYMEHALESTQFNQPPVLMLLFLKQLEI